MPVGKSFSVIFKHENWQHTLRNSFLIFALKILIVIKQ